MSRDSEIEKEIKRTEEELVRIREKEKNYMEWLAELKMRKENK